MQFYSVEETRLDKFDKIYLIIKQNIYKTSLSQNIKCITFNRTQNIKL